MLFHIEVHFIVIYILLYLHVYTHIPLTSELSTIDIHSIVHYYSSPDLSLASLSQG